VQKVVAYVSVETIEEASPRALWARHKTVAGISRRDFFSYYGESSIGYGGILGDVFRLKPPRDLNTLSEGMTPPQSFVYVDDTIDVRDHFVAACNDSAAA